MKMMDQISRREMQDVKMQDRQGMQDIIAYSPELTVHSYLRINLTIKSS